MISFEELPDGLKAFIYVLKSNCTDNDIPILEQASESAAKCTPCCKHEHHEQQSSVIEPVPVQSVDSVQVMESVVELDSAKDKVSDFKDFDKDFDVSAIFGSLPSLTYQETSKVALLMSVLTSLRLGCFWEATADGLF